MRMLDPDKKLSIKSLQLFLTTKEASQFIDDLQELLKDPEANEHFHIYSDDHSREISCSLLTDAKLIDLSRYTKLEQKIILEE
jgi:hypothetical protein